MKTWWSTRLYLLASLAQHLTPVRRILIVDSRRQPTVQTSAETAPATKERFIGQLSTTTIL
jgi:hypothetical protein